MDLNDPLWRRINFYPTYPTMVHILFWGAGPLVPRSRSVLVLEPQQHARRRHLPMVRPARAIWGKGRNYYYYATQACTSCVSRLIQFLNEHADSVNRNDSDIGHLWIFSWSQIDAASELYWSVWTRCCSLIGWARTIRRPSRLYCGSGPPIHRHEFVNQLDSRISSWWKTMVFRRLVRPSFYILLTDQNCYYIHSETTE